ncbi:MAG: fructose-1,6-bisphosphatase [Clostridia bacterium]|nr:fructose-1,6-bisphosphatase [Clostridia bacterium]
MSDRKYLLELSRRYPTRSAVESEIIKLSAILNLPKGTEHFLSDIHGEHEAFLHIRRNASGAIRRKVDILFENEMDEHQRAELATLIYYPEEKLAEIREGGEISEEWYITTIERMVQVCRAVSAKYTRSRVELMLRSAAEGYDHIIDELMSSDNEEKHRGKYYENILKTIIRLDSADRFISALAAGIKKLVVEHLHIVGDIFDRGPRADIIMDELEREESLDIQWGNHDILWMSAASGSRTAIATVINNSMTYKNLDVIEIGYGISLRPLALFASEVYRDSDLSIFMPKGNFGGDAFGGDDDLLIAKMHKAISIIQHKLEGQVIGRHPEFHMEDRLLLDKIDRVRGTVRIGDRDYALRDNDFPTLDMNNPYKLTEGEEEVMKYLKHAFMRSEKLTRHIRLLFRKGGMYTVYNRNLLFHGCIPLNEDGSFMALDAFGGKSGRELMDAADKAARRGYFAKEGSLERQMGKDILWFLWCGKDSPLCARKKIATFERLYVADESTWVEPKNKYYDSWNNKRIAEKILKEFGLGGVGSHIINGHIPIKSKKGEAPLKAGGKLIVIDGGFCKAYHSQTGIGGYTLIYSSDGMRLCAHGSFNGYREAVKNNADIISDTVIFDQTSDKIRIRDTDLGVEIRDKIADLMMLRSEYEAGFRVGEEII